MRNCYYWWVLPYFVFLFVFGCARDKQLVRVTSGIKESVAMQAAIVEKVPQGTKLNDAKQFMEREGFSCSIKRNETFGDRSGIDYLYCNRSDRVAFGVEQHWKIALILADDKIDDIIVNTSSVGF